MISLEQYRRVIGLYASRTGGLNKINVKKNCSLSTTYNGEMTRRKQQK